MARQTLDQWIREVLLDPDKDGPCTAISLVHMSGQVEKELHTVKFGGKPRDPKELAALFRGKAENYAAEITGVQTFNLLAFYNDRAESQARKPFMIHGENDYGGLATEPPTKEGQTMQGMRHTEAVIQLAFRQTQVLFDSSQRTIDRLITHNERLMTENREAMDIFKQMMIQHLEEKHSRKMEEMQYARSSEERAKWISMLPALANSLTGRNIFPQHSEDTALLDSIIDSLDEKTAMQLQSAVPPALWGAVMERATRRLREKHAKEAEKMAASQMNGKDTGALQ